MNKTIHTYIIKEIWPPFFATLFVSIFIILATRMLSIVELVVTKGVHVTEVVRMILYLLPDIVAFALPAASLIAVLVAFLRFSADSEIIALESSGVSLYQMLPPVVLISLLGFVLGMFVSVVAVPWGNRSFKNLLVEIAESRAHLEIKEHIFCEPFDNVVFYVGRYSDRDRLMQDVFVTDTRDEATTNTIVAREARIFSHPTKRIVTLHFREGTIFVAERDLQSARTIAFESYNLNIGLRDIMAALASRKKKPKEMGVGELTQRLKEIPKGSFKYNEMMIELMEKFSIPLAVFFMGIIGVPLGAQLWARGRSTGIAVGLLVFFGYYVFLAAMRSVGETGAVSPAAGVWFPDLFLLICCVYLLRLSARERTSSLLTALFAAQDVLDAKIYALKREWGRWRRPAMEAAPHPGVREWEQLSFLPPSPAEGPEETPAAPLAYVGSVRMDKFHRVDCKWAKRISPENRYSFQSRAQAIEQGFAPCKVCKP